MPSAPGTLTPDSDSSLHPGLVPPTRLLGPRWHHADSCCKVAETQCHLAKTEGGWRFTGSWERQQGCGWLRKPLHRSPNMPSRCPRGQQPPLPALHSHTGRPARRSRNWRGRPAGHCMESAPCRLERYFLAWRKPPGTPRSHAEHAGQDVPTEGGGRAEHTEF